MRASKSNLNHARVCEESETRIGPRAIVYPQSSLRRLADMEEHKPVKCPLDSGEEDECLEQMLEDDPGPIIPDPASADRLCEWHANPGAQDKYGIAERQGAGVSREHGRKSQIERCALCFDASNVRADRP